MNNLIYYFLIIKAKLNYYLKNLLRLFIETKKVEGINNDKKYMHNLYPRYLIVKVINSVIKVLKYIRDYFDVKINKLQITKNYANGEKTIILDSEHYWADYVTIKNIINHIDKNNKYSNNIQSCIFMKFELDGPKYSKPICLKKYITKYKDHDFKHHHTISNIVLFNDIKVQDDTKLKIIMFNKGTMKELSIPYKKVCNNHINYFCDPESLNTFES